VGTFIIHITHIFMKWILPITIASLTVLTKGDVKAQVNPIPPCRAWTLDLRAIQSINLYIIIPGKVLPFQE
jgi:hypothetical protein